jgi:hypothetical protein
MSILIPSLAMGWGPAPPPPPTGWTLPMQPEAVFIAAFPILLGLIFMIKARTEMVDIMKPGSIPKAYGNKDAAFFQGVMVHYFFILGIAVHVLGVINLGICLGYPPVLAFLPAFACLTTMVLFMAIFRTGIAGAPSFNFPPIPGVIGLPIITGVLAYQAQQEWEGYGFTDEEKMGFAALVLAPIVITQALGKYHRVKGYAPDQVAKDFGYKPLPPGSSSNLLKDDKMNPLEAMGASMKGLMDSFNKPETPDKKRK